MRETRGERADRRQLLLLPRLLLQRELFGHVLTDGEEHDFIADIAWRVGESPPNIPVFAGLRAHGDLDGLLRRLLSGRGAENFSPPALDEILLQESFAEGSAKDLVAPEARHALRLAVEETHLGLCIEAQDHDPGELDGVDVTMLGFLERTIELHVLEALAPLDAGHEVIAVGVEHDRELQVEETHHRFARSRGVRTEGGFGDSSKLYPDERHRGEHVALGKPDLDVNAPNFLGVLVVALVVGAGQNAAHPALEGPLQPRDLVFAREDGVRGFMLANALVELLGYARKMRRGRRVKRRQKTGVFGIEGHITFQFLKAGFQTALPLRPLGHCKLFARLRSAQEEEVVDAWAHALREGASAAEISGREPFLTDAVARSESCSLFRQRSHMNIPRVYKYMTPSPHSIGRDQSLAMAHQMMREHKIRHLPVLDAGVLVGLVSERDLLFVETLRDVDPSRVKVEEAMTAEPYFVNVDTPVKDIALAMIEHKYGSAVVVDHGNVVGIFTTIDALRALLDLDKKSSVMKVAIRP